MKIGTENIGKKVYELVKIGGWNYTINKEKTYTIIGYKSQEECGDYDSHYVIKDDEGNEKELKYYEVIFCPIESEYAERTIYNYLNDNGIFGDVYVDSEGVVEVHISWGDWKHDHGWCADLMNYIGYGQDDVQVTEENGSDTYSAIHYYSKR